MLILDGHHVCVLISKPLASSAADLPGWPHHLVTQVLGPATGDGIQRGSHRLFSAEPSGWATRNGHCHAFWHLGQVGVAAHSLRRELVLGFGPGIAEKISADGDRPGSI